MKIKNETRRLAVVGMLLGITLLLTFTQIGIIPIPPFGATIMHIPVILGVILEGPVAGGIIALIFGLASIFKAFSTPLPTSFIFMDPLVAVLPRLVIPLVTWAVMCFRKNKPRTKSKVAIAAAAGSLTNTIGVLSMIYLLYAARYAEAVGISPNGVLASIAAAGGIQGSIEAAICVAVCVGVVFAVDKRKNIIRG